MLMTGAMLMLMFWLLGVVSTYTLQGFIHIFLVVAILAVLVRIIQGRQPL